MKSVTRSTGVTTLHITHSNSEAEALANRRFVLKDGIVSEQAEP